MKMCVMCIKVRKVIYWKLDLGRNFYNRNIDYVKFERINEKIYFRKYFYIFFFEKGK